VTEKLLVQDLRQARADGPFEGRVFLTCDNSRCAVLEVELRINEGREGSRPFQWPLSCPRCRDILVYHGLE
jgi:hypothetical protein